MHACSRNALGLRVAHSYVLYERISEMCFLPAGGAYAAGMPRGVNPTTRASAGIFRKDFTFCSGTGSGLYLLTLFTDLMASRASMSSQTVRFGVVIISVSGPLFPPGEPSATMLGGRLAGRLRGRRGFFRQVDTDNLRHFTRSDGIAGRSPSPVGAAGMKPGYSQSEYRAPSGANRLRP